jgi:hypothetical protein
LKKPFAAYSEEAATPIFTVRRGSFLKSGVGCKNGNRAGKNGAAKSPMIGTLKLWRRLLLEAECLR